MQRARVSTCNLKTIPGIVFRELFMRYHRESKPFYKIDFDYLKEIPIEEVGRQLNIRFGNKGKCFCPDPNCPDAGSQNMGAGITPRGNTIHCFICNGTWSPYTLIGLTEFGLTPRESYQSENIARIAEYLYENNFPCVEKIEPTNGNLESETEERKIPPMPSLMLRLYRESGKIEHTKVPLYRCIGFSTNPFTKISVAYQSSEEAVKRRESYEIDSSTAALLFIKKALEVLEINYELLGNELLVGKTVELISENAVIKEYLPKLYPLINDLDKKELHSVLLYTEVMTEQESLRLDLCEMFPREMKLIHEKLEMYYRKEAVLETEEEREEETYE